MVLDRPTGTVTFLFTDVEGSTRLWEEHPAEMQAALQRHDEILRAAIEAHHGYVFSTAGDAFAAAFARAHDAVLAAVQAQLALAAEPWPDGVPVAVRMGLHTGEAQERDGDYFGTALNRAARIMAAGHGGQILVSASTRAVLQHVGLIDQGEHRLKDLSTPERIFQVAAQGLASGFGALRTVERALGNLPRQGTSFVGRDREVGEVCELVRAHRLVTLTGVGGVGKTRLAVEVAAELIEDFPEGVWLVELAGVGDPDAVPDAVAAALGITPQAGITVADNVARALSGRRLLLVMDNCEHVLDAAAELIEPILSRTDTVRVLATSRENLRVDAEHVWSVPSLDVRAGAASAAVQLFVDRALAVAPALSLEDADEVAAVTEICERLDGIALGIELAAARMASMGPKDIRDRLGDRFRLLSGSRRGLERHQTLHNVVLWSYELLDAAERELLNRCSVFADGFDLATAVVVCGEGLDEYTVLDLLDSLVRKSLVTIQRSGGHVRYGMLETIRQFAEAQLDATGSVGEIRDCHARHFAEQAVRNWAIWESPDQLTALNWVDVEFANLRAGFRWAADRADLVCAASIAAHTTMMAWLILRYESVGWAEEILEAATEADIPQLPRLYTAASLVMTGRPDAAIAYAQTARELEADPRYDPLQIGWSANCEANAYLYSGRLDRWLEISEELVTHSGFARVVGLDQLLHGLSSAGRAEEARAIADETLATARDYGCPFWIAFALDGSGRAFSDSDPIRALDLFHEGIEYATAGRLLHPKGWLSLDAAGLEATHGKLEEALELFDTSLDSFHRSGDQGSTAAALGYLAVFFDRLERPEIAATIYGSCTHHGSSFAINFSELVEHLRAELSEGAFAEAVATGTAMEITEAVHYARHQIQLARMAS